MEQMFSKSGLAAVVATSVLLGACGGGGGGGSSDGGGGGGNGSSQLQLDPDGYGERQAQIRTQADYDAVAQAYEDTDNIDQLIGEVEEALSIVGSLSAEEPVVRQAAASACENDGGAVDVTTGTNSTRVVFDNCELTTASIPNLLLNGRFSQDVSGSDSDQTLVTRYDISGENLDTGEPLRIQGQESYRVVQTGSESGRVEIATDRIEYLLGDNYVALKNTNVVGNISGYDLNMTLSAQLISSSIDGYLTLSTPTGLAGDVNGACPSEGVVRIEGDGSVEVRYGQSTGTGSAVEVILNDSTSERFDTCEAGSAWVI